MQPQFLFFLMLFYFLGISPGFMNNYRFFGINFKGLFWVSQTKSLFCLHFSVIYAGSYLKIVSDLTFVKSWISGNSCSRILSLSHFASQSFSAERASTGLKGKQIYETGGDRKQV